MAGVSILRVCGHRDWRMPTVKELQSFVDYGIAYPGPTLDTAWFPNTLASSFWSASAGARNSNDAWYVLFTFGAAYYDYKGLGKHVRLVRAGQ